MAKEIKMSTGLSKERLAQIAQEIVLAVWGRPAKTKATRRGKVDYLKLFQLIELESDAKTVKKDGQCPLFKHEKNLEACERKWTEQGKRWKMRICRFDCDILAEEGVKWLKDSDVRDMTDKEFLKYLNEHSLTLRAGQATR